MYSFVARIVQKRAYSTLPSPRPLDEWKKSQFDRFLSGAVTSVDIREAQIFPSKSSNISQLIATG